jgi:RNA polymerase sigma factor (sigma-70 family)
MPRTIPQTREKYIAPTTRKELVVANFIPLAKKWARMYASRFRLDYDDALAAAMLGLTDAVEKWEPKRGAFATVAILWVRARLNEELRRQRRRKAVEVNDFDMRIAGEEIGGTFIDHAPDPAPSPEDELIEADELRHTRETVLPLLAKLSDRERTIIQRTAMGEETLEPVAADLGISRERVRQIRESALAKLRTAITGETTKPVVAEGFVPPEVEAATPEAMGRLSSSQRLVLETMYRQGPPLSIGATAKTLAMSYSSVWHIYARALAALGATPPSRRRGPPAKPRQPAPKPRRVADKARRAPAPPPPAPVETFTDAQLAMLPDFARRLVEARCMTTPPVDFAALSKEIGKDAKYHFLLAMRALHGGAVPKAWARH